MDLKIRLDMPAKKEPHSAFGKRLFALRKTRGLSSVQKQRLWKRFQKMDVLPTKDQRAVIRLINSLAGSAHAEAS